MKKLFSNKIKNRNTGLDDYYESMQPGPEAEGWTLVIDAENEIHTLTRFRENKIINGQLYSRDKEIDHWK